MQRRITQQTHANSLSSELLCTGSDAFPLLRRGFCVLHAVVILTPLQLAHLLQLLPLRLPLAPQLINVHDVPPWHVHLHCIPIREYSTTTARLRMPRNTTHKVGQHGWVVQPERHTCRKSCAADTITSCPASSRACWTSMWSAALLSKTLPSLFRLRSAAPLREHKDSYQHSGFKARAQAHAGTSIDGNVSLPLDCKMRPDREREVRMRSPGSARAVARAEVGEH